MFTKVNFAYLLLCLFGRDKPIDNIDEKITYPISVDLNKAFTVTSNKYDIGNIQNSLNHVHTVTLLNHQTIYIHLSAYV